MDLTLSGSTFRLKGRWDTSTIEPATARSATPAAIPPRFRYFVDDDVAVVVLHNGNTNPDALIDGYARILLPHLAR